jgi:hypothetical protein
LAAKSGTWASFTPNWVRSISTSPIAVISAMLLIPSFPSPIFLRARAADFQQTFKMTFIISDLERFV